MKRYKQLALVVIIVTLIVSLSGCIIIPVSKYYDIPAEEVVSVQFYDLCNEESAGYSGFDKTYGPVYTLPEEDNEVFLNDFSKLEFSDTIVIVLAAIDQSFSYGDWVIRINGQYAFYSSGGYGETFDAEGNCISSTHFSCDEDEPESLNGKYYKIE